MLWKFWLVNSIQTMYWQWSWLDKCNIYSRYYLCFIKFKFCLVSKPLVCVVFSNFCQVREVSFANCFKNVIIKQSLNLDFVISLSYSSNNFFLFTPLAQKLVDIYFDTHLHSKGICFSDGIWNRHPYLNNPYASYHKNLNVISNRKLHCC